MSSLLPKGGIEEQGRASTCLVSPRGAVAELECILHFLRVWHCGLGMAEAVLERAVGVGADKKFTGESPCL